MCKYCDFSVEREITLDETEFTELAIHQTPNTTYLVAYGHDTALSEINFCPYCGKSLKNN